MRLYLRALSYFRPDLHLVGLWLAVIAGSTLLGLMTAWPMAVLIDCVVAPVPKRDWIHNLFLSCLPSSKLGQVIGLAAFTLAFKLVGDALGTAQNILSNTVNFNGLMRVRCDLYRKLQALNLTYHKSRPQGDAIYRISTDTQGCHQILSVLVSTAVAAGTLVVMTVILASRSVPLTLTALSIAPLLAAANVFFGRRFRVHTMQLKEVDTQFTTTVQRSVASIGLIQAFGRESQEYHHFHRTVRQTIAAWWKLNWQQIAYNLTVGLIFGLGTAAVFAYGGYMVYRNLYVSPSPAGMSVGDLMIFTQYLAMLFAPLCALTGFTSSIQGGVAGAQRVFEVLDLDPVISDAPDALPLPRQPRELALRNVSFQYLKDKPVLRDVNVTIRPGQMVAFVGSSGVGKSTLLNLLPRFYDPSEGSMTLDGIDARQVKVHDLRRHVALVLQDSVILPTTVAENIAYGRPRATKEEIRRAAQLAGADDFIDQLPDGYDTQIAEGGANLSGGQRQRLSIARALLTEAPIIVLDEPTSALDPHHEQLVTDRLNSLKGTRTIVIVTHHLSTVTACDQIFVMDGGRIVEQGTHADLVARQGLYYEMARHQLNLPAPTYAAAA